MRLATFDDLGQLSGYEQQTAFESEERATDLPIETPWSILLHNDDQPDIELAIVVREDKVLGMRLNTQDDADIDVNIWQGYEHGVSRRHVLLHPTDKGLFVVDLDSTNGSILNGRPMIPNHAYELSSEDILTMGKLQIHVVSVFRGDAQVERRAQVEGLWNEVANKFRMEYA